jgi:tetratricopeptide (TPR) repeat protein
MASADAFALAARHYADGKLAVAQQLAYSVVATEPRHAEALYMLGLIAWRTGNLGLAAEHLNRSLQLKPDSPDLANNLGIVLHELGQLDAAVSAYRHALHLRPALPSARTNLATALKEQGYLEEAIVHYREAVKIQPDQAAVYYSLSDLATAGLFEFAPEELSRIKLMLASEHLSAFDRSLCAFVLARVLDKEGHFEEAFACYQQANNLRKRLLQEQNLAFSVSGHEDLIDRLITVYDQAYFERVRGWGTDSELPLFIVGMPRSGSSLVEQILASHPRVCGTGELGEIPELLGLFRSQVSELTQRSPDSCPLTPVSWPVMFDERTARGLAADYLKRLEHLGQGTDRVINKTLENHLHLGVIATLFPHARIVHCRRDPLDVCVSCYFQNLHKISFAWSLEDIGAYYRGYEKLMDHWRRVMPIEIHDVCYEQLVEDQETVTRKLVGWCGLEWDDRCLSFWKTRRVVRTASTVQVRKPVSTESVGRWRHYRSHLEPLLKALGR